LKEGVSDEEILAMMVKFPILVNRPIVCCHNGVKLCRPSESVFDLLDRSPLGPIYKEGGEMVITDSGDRLF
jgi:arsenate reductase